MHRTNIQLSIKFHAGWPSRRQTIAARSILRQRKCDATLNSYQHQSAEISQTTLADLENLSTLNVIVDVLLASILRAIGRIECYYRPPSHAYTLDRSFAFALAVDASCSLTCSSEPTVLASAPCLSLRSYLSVASRHGHSGTQPHHTRVHSYAQ